MNISKVLAYNLVKYREERGLSVLELAQKCNVSRQTIYQIENETSWIGLSLIKKLSKVLKIKEYELFQFDSNVS